MKQVIVSTLFLLTLFPNISSAATWWVRPDTNGNGTDLNYGTEDGTSFANAFDGFVDVTGLSAGDTVCLPDASEPFFERLDTPTAGTATAPITWKSCGSSKALFWSADGLSGDRSFDSGRNVVGGAAYEWVQVDATLWRKRIDIRARMLWEDSVWLTPRDINALTEPQVITTLQAGEWGVRDNGDSTFRIYYRATASSKTPSTTTIRCDKMDLSDGTPVGIIRADAQWNILKDIEVRGHTAVNQARALEVVDTSNVTLENMLFSRNQIGPSIMQTTIAGGGHYWKNVSVLDSSETGAYISPLAGVTGFVIHGGEYSRNNNLYYNGTGFAGGDGDGIGIGQAGGTLTGMVIHGIQADNNANAGIFIGTTFPMTVTNMYITGSTFSANKASCISEGSTSRINGEFFIVGFVCRDQPFASFAGININPAAAGLRTVRVANGVFTNNRGLASLRFGPTADNNMQIYNLIFYANSSFSFDRGDIYTNEQPLIGDEVFRNIIFYSRPNSTSTMAKIGATTYQYTAAGFTAFNAATGHTGGSVNVDPLFIHGTHSPSVTSSARGTGFPYNNCMDARGRICNSPPDIGGYQVTSGDPASTRIER